MNIPTTGPISGALVCARYKIDAGDWSEMDAADRMGMRMAYACDDMHVQEDPGHNNTGPEVNRILQAVGLDPGNPWCISTPACYLIDSGVNRDKLPDLAGLVHGLSGSWADWAHKEHRVIVKPKRFCVGLIFHGPRSGHGVVLVGPGKKPGDWRTLEGNSNDDGSREGYEICRLERSVAKFDLLIDVHGLA